jgi:hypothetical protein
MAEMPAKRSRKWILLGFVEMLFGFFEFVGLCVGFGSCSYSLQAPEAEGLKYWAIVSAMGYLATAISRLLRRHVSYVRDKM